jgi:hypothetical protein
MLGSKYTWINLNNYFSSYLSYKDGKDHFIPNDIYYLMSFFDVLYYAFIFVGVKLEDLKSLRFSILSSILIQYLSILLIIIFTSNPYFILFSVGLFNMGNGLSYLPSIKNCWKYFPNRQGLILGIILSGSGLSSSALTYISEFIIINPEKKESKSDIFPDEINHNFEIYLYICGIFIFLCGIISFFLNFEYKEELTDIDILTDSNTGDEQSSLEVISNYNLSKRPSIYSTINLINDLHSALISSHNLKLIFIGASGLCK